MKIPGNFDHVTAVTVGR